MATERPPDSPQGHAAVPAAIEEPAVLEAAYRARLQQLRKAHATAVETQQTWAAKVQEVRGAIRELCHWLRQLETAPEPEQPEP